MGDTSPDSSGHAGTLAFLKLPQRSRKPRKTGLTIVRDYGPGLYAARDMVSSVGEYVDFIKFRTVLSALESEDLLRAKIDPYRSADIGVFTQESSSKSPCFQVVLDTSSFAFGRLAMDVPAGYLTDRFSPSL